MVPVALRIAGLSGTWASEYKDGTGTRLVTVELKREGKAEVLSAKFHLENYQEEGSSHCMKLQVPAFQQVTSEWSLHRLNPENLDKIRKLEQEAIIYSLKQHSDNGQLDVFDQTENKATLRQVPEDLADLDAQLQKQIDERDPLAAALQEENEGVPANV